MTPEDWKQYRQAWQDTWIDLALNEYRSEGYPVFEVDNKVSVTVTVYGGYKWHLSTTPIS